MPVLTFPIAARGDFCFSCGQSMATHGDRCLRDITVGQDQHAVARRQRLARLQIRRALKVRGLRHFIAAEGL